MAPCECNRKSRSAARKELFGEIYKEEHMFVTKGKLQTGIFVIGRMLHLCKTEKGKAIISRDDARKIVAKELRNDWIHKNVYPIEKRSISKKIRKDYEMFLSLRKSERDQSRARSERWYENAKDFNEKMSQRAYDIRTHNVEYQKQLEKEFNVKMTTEDEKFYEDNCCGAYQAICTPTVPKAWTKKWKRVTEREESIEKKQAEEMLKKQSEKHVTEEFLKEPIDVDYSETTPDPVFEPLSRPMTTPISGPHAPPRTKPATRSSKCETPSTSFQEDMPSFPKVKVRHGPRKLNENLIRCAIQCLAKYKVTPQDLSNIIVNVANIIFQQDWTLDDNYDDIECSSDEEEVSDFEVNRPKKTDLSYKFPSRRTLNPYLEDAAYLNLKLVASEILNKAGYKSFHVKGDHVTIMGPSSKRKVFTTGYAENIGHSGVEGAKTYEFKLQCLAILSNSTVGEIKQHVDFWMSDRVGDCGTLLESLVIEGDRVIKCCAHVILGADHAIDKVFRDTEQKIGVQNLLHLSAGERVFSSPSSSIHTGSDSHS
ncbi:hypothetical protein SNE40_019782 [Patella caerulea]|uniref:Uncharacterized protein n=1 Tax=Patella caerulea TaxID=87958 RepID=A0AAN8GDI5_PATCE